MKLLNIRTFSGRDLPQVMKFLSVDLTAFLKSVLAFHTRLTFGDNFESFTYELPELAAGASTNVPNRLGTSKIWWFPVRITGENALVETAVTSNFLTIQNAGSVAVTATVIVMRQ